MGSSCVPFCQYDAVANPDPDIIEEFKEQNIEATKANGMVNSEEPRNKLENLGFIKLLHQTDKQRINSSHRACCSGLRLQLCDLRHLLKSILNSTCPTLGTAQATAQV